MSLPVFSDIRFRSSKTESILIPTATVFYDCNNRDSAGAELKKHAAPSNSQCGSKTWIIFTVAQLILGIIIS